MPDNPCGSTRARSVLCPLLRPLFPRFTKQGGPEADSARPSALFVMPKIDEAITWRPSVEGNAQIKAGYALNQKARGILAPEDRIVTHMTPKLPPVGSGSAVASGTQRAASSTQRSAARGPGRAPPPASALALHLHARTGLLAEQEQFKQMPTKQVMSLVAVKTNLFQSTVKVVWILSLMWIRHVKE